MIVEMRICLSGPGILPKFLERFAEGSQGRASRSNPCGVGHKAAGRRKIGAEAVSGGGRPPDPTENMAPETASPPMGPVSFSPLQ